MTERDYARYLAVRVRKYRQLHGWTMGELAESAGISLHTVQDIEKGRKAEGSSAKTIYCLARSLGVPMEYLLGEQENYTFFRTAVECVCGRTVTIEFRG